MATATILRMKPINAKYAYVHRIKNAESAMNTLRTEMYGHDIEHMAAVVDVSVACLYSIRSGRTKWPRPKTFFGLINYLNLEMHLVKV